VAARAKQNRIKWLMGEGGQTCLEKQAMEKMTREFFQELYKKDPEVCPDDLLNFVQPKITEDTNEQLCKDFTNEKISNALFQIRPLKAPGPDEFLARFLRRNWDVMWQDVTRGVQQFFETGIMPAGINETSIVIIPKKDDPSI
jgi:hypothetical protein